MHRESSNFVPYRLRLGSLAPNFKAETTAGFIDFHEWVGNKWAILFSHPEDYTPVCTTELAALAKYEPEFVKRGVKLIGLSANSVETRKCLSFCSLLNTQYLLAIQLLELLHWSRTAKLTICRRWMDQ